MNRRSTVYFEPELHRALKVKAAHVQRSVSNLVNDAVRAALREDEQDLRAFAERASEPTISYEALLGDLERSGKI
jgi:plasmid stability protein